MVLSQLTEFSSCRPTFLIHWMIPPSPKPGSPYPFYPLFSMVFHISGIPQYLTFCEQLILVIFILSRSFYTITYVHISFLCKAVMLSHCLYRPISCACLSVSGTWVAHTAWVWEIMLLWTWGCVKCVFLGEPLYFVWNLVDFSSHSFHPS